MFDPTVLTDRTIGIIVSAIVLFVVALGLFLYFFIYYFLRLRKFLELRQLAGDALMPQISYFSEKGTRVRQEDSVYISPLEDMDSDGVVSLVSDGMGGLKHGDEISAFVSDTIKKMHPLKFDATEDNSGAIRMISKKIYDKYNRSGGATVAMVHVKGDYMHFYSCGDSNIILVRSNKAVLLNPKQNYLSVLVRKCALEGKTTESAYLDSDSKALIDFVGNAYTRVFNTSKPLRLLEDDVIIVCSDGVTDALGFKSLNKYVFGSARSIAERLKINIRNKNIQRQDNYTAVVIKMMKSII